MQGEIGECEPSSMEPPKSGEGQANTQLSIIGKIHSFLSGELRKLSLLVGFRFYNYLRLKAASDLNGAM